MIDAFDDPIEDIFGISAPEVSGETKARRETALAHIEPLSPVFVEVCPKCRGTGSYGRFGQCFSCKGRGKHTFKTSSADRARSREQAAARKEREAASAWETFVAADPARAAWLSANEARSPFAQSLKAGAVKWGRLTDGQAAAVDRAIAKDAEYAAAKQARASAAPEVNLNALLKAMETARANGLKRPVLRLLGVSVKPVDTGVNAGGLYVYSGEDRAYLGKINREGRFLKSFACTQEQADAVVAASADPKGSAVEYGRKTGNCACCGRTLTDPKSIELGIGPICAEKWGW